ncbi:MAG: amidohydrolase family protein, partial [Bacillota bacterium]|nr:amidohydrolase family protein [Bacillota bacterium]
MENTYLIKCGKLFDGINLCIKDNIEILVDKGLIVDISKNIPLRNNIKIIDLTENLVTPGLIDAHIHPEFFEWKKLYNDYHKYTDEWIALAALYTAQKTLERGFTTIRVMGSLSREYGLLDVKNSINSGYFNASKIIVSPHSFSSTGGHGDLSQIVKTNPNISSVLSSKSIGSGVDFFTEATRRSIKYGADFIKIIVSGGFSTSGDSPYEQQLNDDELIAIISTARERDIPVTAHAYTPKIIKKLIKFGINGIEHGSLIDDETAGIMEEKGVYLVPTFSPFDKIILDESIGGINKNKSFEDKLVKYKEELIKGREIILKSKIKLGLGSDHVYSYNSYESWREYKSWVDNGINPLVALRSATSINAEILGIDNRGSLKKGNKADIVAWNKN